MPLWPSNTSLDVSMYVSPSLGMPALKNMPAESLVMDEKSFRFGDYKDKRDIHTTITVPRAVQENGTLYAHFYVSLSGAVQDPTSSKYDTTKAYHFARPLTQYLAKKKQIKTRNLLSASNMTEGPDHDTSDTTGPTITSLSVSYTHLTLPTKRIV